MTDTDTDQCIICLESLPSLSTLVLPLPAAAGTIPLLSVDKGASSETEDADALNRVASLDGCDHILHDSCIRVWAQKTNTCPICRTPFQVVHSFHGPDCTPIASYAVEERKQIPEFDVREWLDQNDDHADENDPIVCWICSSSNAEECLLLCDGCNAPYHSYCIGLDDIPEGPWFCQPCCETFDLDQASEGNETPEVRHLTRRRAQTLWDLRRSDRYPHLFPRTRGRIRRARQQVRSIEWQGPWAQVTGRVYDGLNIDLDNPEDDENLLHFRRSQQRSERDNREYRRWQQRLNIASRLGAREIFSRTIPSDVSEHLDSSHAQASQSAQEVLEARSDSLAWMALGLSPEGENAVSSSPGRRKRRAHSETLSLGDAAREPERKLKRPRTRRLPVTHHDPLSLSKDTENTHDNANGPDSTNSRQRPDPPLGEPPTFLSSLLHEMDVACSSDDETMRNTLSNRPTSAVHSPAPSPAPEPQDSSRAFSATPPPLSATRPSSPQLLLSSHIEPQYGPANYSPCLSGGESDHEGKPDGRGATSPDLHQPRPRRLGSDGNARSQGSSPNRSLISIEAKLNINTIVRSALSPHWHAQELSSRQYSTINWEISRKLYDEVHNGLCLDDDVKKNWEKIAKQEVARAVADLRT